MCGCWLLSAAAPPDSLIASTSLSHSSHLMCNTAWSAKQNMSVHHYQNRCTLCCCRGRHAPAKCSNLCIMSGCPESAEACARFEKSASVELLHATLMASVNRLLPRSLLNASRTFVVMSPEPWPKEDAPSTAPRTAAETSCDVDCCTSCSEHHHHYEVEMAPGTTPNFAVALSWNYSCIIPNMDC